MSSPSKRIAVILIGLTVILLAVAVWQGSRSAARLEQTRELGTVRVYPSWWWLRGVAFVFSAGGGWNDADAAAARGLARRGYHVFGIDTARLLAAWDAGTQCVYLPSVLENFSRREQYRLGARHYRLPLLAGHDEGATLVYMTHLQAPPLSFSAAAALNPAPMLPLRAAFCDHPAQARTAHLQTLRTEPRNAAVPLRIWADAAASAATRAFARAATGEQTSGAVATASLDEAYRSAFAALAAGEAKSAVADLPLVEVRPQHASNTAFAVLYSGDGGWRDLDKRLAGVLAHKGLPVVGVDVLSYYWHGKPPEQGAADLERIVRYYRAHWGRERVVLIGFSFGANVLPFLYNRLPDDLRHDVKLISLLSPERTTAFSVDPTEWVHLKSKRAVDQIAPELARIPASLVQCVYGEEEEKNSLCTLPAAAKTRVLRKPGGHHFDEDYERLAGEVLAAIAP